MRAVQPAMATGGTASVTTTSARARKASAAGPSPRATGRPVSPPETTPGSRGIWASRGSAGMLGQGLAPTVPKSG